jgi:hypothetical protein
MIDHWRQHGIDLPYRHEGDIKGTKFEGLRKTSSG